MCLDGKTLAELNEITSIFKCSRSAFLRYIISEYKSYLNEEVDLEAVDYVNELRHKLGDETDETE